MQNQQIVSSLYFPKQTYSHTYRGFFEPNISNNLSVLERKHKKKYDMVNYNQEDCKIIVKSAKQIQIQKKLYKESELESLSLENESPKKKQTDSFIIQCKLLHKEQQSLPSIQQQYSQNIKQKKNKQEIIKPIMKRQILFDYQIKLSFQNKSFQELSKGANIRCIALNQSNNNKDIYYDKLLILNFEGLLMKQTTTFWNIQKEIKPCSNYSEGNLSELCDSSFCPCNLRYNLKNSLKTLSKAYLIIILFKNFYNAQAWTKYFLQENYNFDATYIIKSFSSSLYGGLKLQTIIKDFNKYNITKLIMFDTFCINAYQLNCPNLVQYKIPILECQIQSTLFLFQKQQIYKNFDCYIIYDICMYYFYEKDILNSKRLLNIKSYDLTKSIQYFQNKENKQESQIQLLNKMQQLNNDTNLNKYQEQDNNNLKLLSKDDYLSQWIQETRNSFLHQMKYKFQDQSHSLHYTIGDILVRNQKIIWSLHNKHQQIVQQMNPNMIKKICKLNKQIEQIPQGKQFNNIINCFLCFE